MKSLNFFYRKYIVRQLFSRYPSGNGVTVKILNSYMVNNNIWK